MSARLESGKAGSLRAVGRRLGGFFLRPAEDRGPSLRECFPQVRFGQLGAGDVIAILLQTVWLSILVSVSALGLARIYKWLKSGLSGLVGYTQATLSKVSRITTLIENPEFNRRLDDAADRYSSAVSEFLGRGHSRLKKLALGFGLAAVFLLSITTPFDLGGQVTLLTLMVMTAFLVRNAPGHIFAFLLAFMSLIVSSRYIWWRITATLNWDNQFDLTWGLLLLFAECYTYMILLLSFMQTAWPLRRPVMPMSGDADAWPSVDVYIPTYNEPLDVVRLTVLAAKEMDWPENKLTVYLLDDGRRDEFRDFAREAGVEYVTRSDNRHAKAGNLNNALARTHGEFVAIFDCDHIPTRAFLQMTMGWFQKEPDLSLVQTPHHFYSADPFERSLDQFKSAPNEGQLFYGLIQPSNDLWNAAFFCGSCAVLRKSALERVGGIATETVTEDAHTSLKMHKLGYQSAYIGIPLAAGLATESISSHVGQRVRWARGMAQIFRSDNPFLAKSLSFMQKICYGSAMLHFFSGGPRLIFLTAPLAFLVFHSYVIFSPALSIAVFVIPHILLGIMATNRSQSRFRNAFWGEVYETVLSWYVARPTTQALLNPKAGKFNVTAKGGVIEESALDWKIASPFVVILALNLIGIGFGAWRLSYGDGAELGTVVLNLFWAVFNVVMLGACLAVSQDRFQIRRTHRVSLSLPAILTLWNGRKYRCVTRDFSQGGLSLTLNDAVPLDAGREVNVSLWRGEEEFSFHAIIVARFADKVSLQWNHRTIEEHSMLAQCTFGRSDAWLDWQPASLETSPWNSFRKVIHTSMIGAVRFMDELSKVSPRWARLAATKTKLLMALARLMPRTPSRLL